MPTSGHPSGAARFQFMIIRLFLFLACASLVAQETSENLQQSELVAWCIVPFDAAKRTPEQRAVMLKELGLTRSAYDWRKEHVATFEEEILAYKKHDIEFFAFWGEHPTALRLFQKHKITPQVWKMFASPKGTSQEEKVIQAAKSLESLANRTATTNCKLALYNHGGWSGEPANLVAVCQKLHEIGHKHVGIVYNWHHGHPRINSWAKDLALMKPYLHCLNINGMKEGAEFKILPLGQGEHETTMLQTLTDSGYSGPIGILDHRNDTDSKIALKANLDGLKILKNQLKLK